jgi:peroxiredoxin
MALCAVALGLAGLCTWRVATNQPQTYALQLQQAKIERPAPAFEALDARNEMFRLQRYLGRHRVLVVFFSAELTAAGDPNLLAVREAYPELSRRDVKVVGVSTALPQQNRAAMEHHGDYPFPLVTDVDLTIHRRWGRLSVGTNEPLSGVFLIDRKGAVAALADLPRPVDDLAATLKELCQ